MNAVKPLRSDRGVRVYSLGWMIRQLARGRIGRCRRRRCAAGRTSRRPGARCRRRRWRSSAPISWSIPKIDLVVPLRLEVAVDLVDRRLHRARSPGVDVEVVLEVVQVHLARLHEAVVVAVDPAVGQVSVLDRVLVGHLPERELLGVVRVGGAQHGPARVVERQADARPAARSCSTRSCSSRSRRSAPPGTRFGKDALAGASLARFFAVCWSKRAPKFRVSRFLVNTSPA